MSHASASTQEAWKYSRAEMVGFINGLIKGIVEKTQMEWKVACEGSSWQQKLSSSAWLYSAPMLVHSTEDILLLCLKTNLLTHMHAH